MKSKKHEELLYKELDELESNGYRVLALGEKQPDAIVISPTNEIIAVEILGKKQRRDAQGKSKGWAWDNNKTVNDKRWLYGHYDDIIFVLFDRGDTDWTDRIVATEEWPDMMRSKYAARVQLRHLKTKKEA